MDQESLVLIVVVILLLIGIAPMFALLIQSLIDVHESSKEYKKIRKEIEDLIDRM